MVSSLCLQLTSATRALLSEEQQTFLRGTGRRILICWASQHYAFWILTSVFVRSNYSSHTKHTLEVDLENFNYLWLSAILPFFYLYHEKKGF